MAKARKPIDPRQIATIPANTPAAGENDLDLTDVLPGMLVEIPHLAELSEGGYRPMHVEARLDPPQSEALARLLESLDEGGLRLKSGRRVASSADAVRWLLEAVGEARCVVDLEESEESGVGSSGS